MPDASHAALFDRLPEGYSVVDYNDRRYGVTKSRFAEGRSWKVFAEELGGADVISANPLSHDARRGVSAMRDARPKGDRLPFEPGARRRSLGSVVPPGASTPKVRPKFLERREKQGLAMNRGLGRSRTPGFTAPSFPTAGRGLGNRCRIAPTQRPSDWQTPTRPRRQRFGPTDRLPMPPTSG